MASVGHRAQTKTKMAYICTYCTTHCLPYWLSKLIHVSLLLLIWGFFSRVRVEKVPGDEPCVFAVHTMPEHGPRKEEGMCWRMLTYADVRSRMLTYAHVCSRMLMYADVFTVHLCPSMLSQGGRYVCVQREKRGGGGREREGGREEGRYILCMRMTLSRRKLFVCEPMRLLQISPSMCSSDIRWHKFEYKCFFWAGLSLQEVELVSAITSQFCSREFTEGRSLFLQEYYNMYNHAFISFLFWSCGCPSLRSFSLSLSLSLSLCARVKPYVAGCRKQYVLDFVESTSQFPVLSMC